jgi:hypothetical protein
MENEMERIAEELILLRDYDLSVRTDLSESGTLTAGYDERMEMVHLQNAYRLESMIEEHGWITESKVGGEANEAALLIVLHAISLPDFQHSTLNAIKKAVDANEEVQSHYAFLFDRIRFNERKPQLFGTQFDWDEKGLMSPWTIEFPDRVDQLRAEFGLPPLEVQIAAIRESVTASGALPPADYQKRQEEILEWCRKTGWVS